jgi:hypothetical protein
MDNGYLASGWGWVLTFSVTETIIITEPTHELHKIPVLHHSRNIFWSHHGPTDWSMSD